MAAAQASKGKKKKWSKGKMREKAANQILFDKETYDRFYKEVPKMKCITIASVTERFKIGGALARKAFRVRNTLRSKDYSINIRHLANINCTLTLRTSIALMLSKTELESKGLIKQTYYHRGMPIYTNVKSA